MTIREVLRQGVENLSPRGDARLVAEVLLAFLLGRSKEYLFAHHEEEVLFVVEQDFFVKIAEIRDGRPLAYITHQKEFFGYDLYVDERVLIPRPETELLVEEVLRRTSQKKIFHSSDELVIADVGTGSGCITLALSQKLPSAQFFAVDISPDALEVARKNFEMYKILDRVKVFQSDLLDKIIDQKIDIIVANLPYIGEEKFRFLDKNVEDFEPHSALFGGFDGLQLYKKMFQQIQTMKFQPRFILGEFGFAQCEELKILLNTFFEHKWRIISDHAGIERVFIVDVFGNNLES